ncbi:F-box/kelch-repeat protein At3g23880-like [Rhododendron vialii]|uniref:F-box/kelch-repeat protein At3g23880-like n=1 Tax=Rhododendron vialii TaxID=182163 RepID=UPI00265E05E5|nr:F-box/kelch-repeat protein At3g23880-like [Rhododendron vialii]
MATTKAEPHVPEDVTVEILSRLPLKSLLQFAGVSKRWYSMVSDVTAKRNRSLRVFTASTFRSGGTLSSPDFSSTDEVGHVKSVRNPWTEGSCYWHVNLCGSCNGLLLLALDDDFFLWNPVTNYLKVLSFFRPLFDQFYYYVTGLCYDSSTDEYKVVMAQSPRE